MQIFHSALLAFLPERTLLFKLSVRGSISFHNLCLCMKLSALATDCLTNMKHFKMMGSVTLESGKEERQMQRRCHKGSLTVSKVNGDTSGAVGYYESGYERL